MSLCKNLSRKCVRRAVTFLSLALLYPVAGRAQNNIPAYGISSSVPYRQSGVGNATGRSGSATMTARALLGKDGNTTVELTTGTLDSSATPPGSFGAVQFKPLDPSGNVLFAQNFTPLSTSTGYYSFMEPYFYRGQQVQLQGNINGIDANRADIVTVFETVKLRPDLMVKDVSSPTVSIINEPALIQASLLELNGDTGATSTCALSVDGNNVDQTNGVYVDAGGMVTCLFSYTFSSTGSHTIQVTAANVVPSEWDTSNNSASGTITVVQANADRRSGSFSDSTGGFQASGTSEAWQSGNLVYSFSGNIATGGESQSSQAAVGTGGCAGSTNAVLWNFPVTVSYSESMDGTAEASYNFNVASGNRFGQYFPTPQSICNATAVWWMVVNAFTPVQDHYLEVVSIEYFDGANNIVFIDQAASVNQMAGDITYYSSGFQCNFGNNCSNPANYYSWNSSGQTKYGALIPVGNTWTGSIATQDAAGLTLAGSVDVPLTPYQFSFSQPYTCYDSQSNGYTYHNCGSSTYSFTGKTGRVF